jgi:hypothetical protein
VHRRIQTIQFADDGFGRFGPYERLGIIVLLFDVAFDGDLQIDDGMEDAALQALSGQRGEEVLDGIEPGTRCRREMEDQRG